MATDEFGYDKDLFPNLTVETFDCMICSQIVRNPKECLGCGHLFCTPCIDSWFKKKNQCPNRCSDPIREPTKAIKRMYNDLDVKCEKCDKLLKLGDYDHHLTFCGKPKCKFFNACERYVAKGYEEEQVCSKECSLLSNIKKFDNNPLEQLKLIKEFMNKNFQPQILQNSNQAIKIQPQFGGQVQNGGFTWDSTRKGVGIQVSGDSCQVWLKEAAYMFRTIIANKPLMGGINYWEIIADSRTENELKIGVTCNQNFNYNSAFCDYDTGFSFYGLGQLRHGSNASGPQYGKRFKKEGVLGVCLDMNKGELSFALNGEYLGIAFKDPKLRNGPIYPAVSLLHCAGCKLDSTKPLPNYFPK